MREPSRASRGRIATHWSAGLECGKWGCRPALSRTPVRRWEPDAPTLAALAACATDWRAASPSPGLRWQHAAQLHLTVRFLAAPAPCNGPGSRQALLSSPRAARRPARNRRRWRPGRRACATRPRARAQGRCGIGRARRSAGRHWRAIVATRRKTAASGRISRWRAPGTVRARAPGPAAPRFACTVDALSLVRSTPGPSGSPLRRRGPLAAGDLAAP
jgi:hypothetical protein